MSIEKDYLITKMKLLKFTLIIVSQGKKKRLFYFIVDEAAICI